MAGGDETPPAGEEIHLPGPSILPLIVAVAITATVIGLTITIYMTIAGVILFMVTAGIWIRDTRRDIDELPEEHH